MTFIVSIETLHNATSGLCEWSFSMIVIFLKTNLSEIRAYFNLWISRNSFGRYVTKLVWFGIFLILNFKSHVLKHIFSHQMTLFKWIIFIVKQIIYQLFLKLNFYTNNGYKLSIWNMVHEIYFLRTVKFYYDLVNYFFVVSLLQLCKPEKCILSSVFHTNIVPKDSLISNILLYCPSGFADRTIPTNCIW